MLDDGAARLRRTVDELGAGASHTSGAKDGKEAAYQRRIAELEAQVGNAGFKVFAPFLLPPRTLPAELRGAECASA